MQTRIRKPGSSRPKEDGNTLLSIVIPAHNEALGIADAIDVIAGVLDQCAIRYELIVVDDGSRDATFAKVQELCQERPVLRGLHFSRNFGKEAALLAGLEAAKGDAVITMDADLQHPPALIPQMLEKWREGAKVVHAVKEDRSHDSAFARLRAGIFNGILTRLSGIDVRNSSDFKLLDRTAVDVIVRQLPERRRFYRGLADWVGFEQASIPFAVEQRTAGEGKWSFMALVDLATTAIISFTSAPLRIVTILGSITLVFAFLVAVEALWSWLQGEAVSGFATIIMTVLLLGSFIMISLGIVGEYIAKIYEEIKARPSYIVDSACGFEEEQ